VGNSSGISSINWYCNPDNKGRDKSQKKIQEYLEKELAARTSVVMKQKGEIELQNIEITDSINYAKRIQTSILPDINKLKDTLKMHLYFSTPGIL